MNFELSPNSSEWIRDEDDTCIRQALYRTKSLILARNKNTIEFEILKKGKKTIHPAAKTLYKRATGVYLDDVKNIKELNKNILFSLKLSTYLCYSKSYDDKSYLSL